MTWNDNCNVHEIAVQPSWSNPHTLHVLPDSKPIKCPHCMSFTKGRKVGSESKKIAIVICTIDLKLWWRSAPVSQEL